MMWHEIHLPASDAPCGMTVLVVEDEPVLLMMLSEAFREIGLTVAEAGTAEQALAQLTEGQAALPSVLVTDLNLGPGLDGMALAAEVRRRQPGVVVIYATGNASWLAGQAGAFRPGDQLFAKPYDLAKLADAVQGAA